MTDIYQQAFTVTKYLLANEPSLTREIIGKKVDQVLKTIFAEGNAGSIDRERLIRELAANCVFWQGKPTVLEDVGDHKPWLADKASKIDWKFWKRYQRYLEEEKKFFHQSILTLDDLTDEVLKRLEDPEREGSWDRRGMVVGHVQSGKTAHYTGLICKAADAGYKLIIVLAGMHNSLRSQTQRRLDEGFLGYDSQNYRTFAQDKPLIGVGTLFGEELITVHSLTNSSDKGDFTRRGAAEVSVLPGGADPVLLVVKKHKSVLRYLNTWAIRVRGQTDPLTGKKTVHNIPLLVIDDEADNASVNTNPIPLDENGVQDENYDVSAINGLIRSLLDRFEQSAYVGYTATPFANIFIYPRGETTTHGEDLFPRDFIINLPPPPNYTGAAQVFGLITDERSSIEDQPGLPIIRRITDYHEFVPDKHRKDFDPGELPKSLKQAILSFILSSAARKARGENKFHSAMLIHVTRFTSVQQKIARSVKHELLRVRRLLEYSESLNEGIYRDLEDLWNSDFVSTTEAVQAMVKDPLITPLTWEAVRPYLYDASARIQVKLINGTARDILDYSEHPDGLSVIAIGGDKLSRGLTLEGLSISYYLRASRMYDTLMQMGRWFGFRPGYIDLCRLYTSPELVNWYQYITLASEELRSEFDYMAVLESTPADYGLRVRTHPDGLLITAVNKMRTGTEMEVSYGNSLIETVVFDRDIQILTDNQRAIDQTIRSIGHRPELKDNHYLWRDVPVSIILEMMDHYVVHSDSRKAHPKYLKEYLQKRVALGELTLWTVVLINNRSKKTSPTTIGGFEVGLTKRNEPDNDSSDKSKYRLIKAHLIDPKHELIDLSQEEIEKALKTMKKRRAEKNLPDTDPKYPSGPFIRETRSPQRGLLLIYPLKNPRETEPPTLGLPPVLALAYSISKSASPGDVKVKYTVNNVYWEQEFGV